MSEQKSILQQLYSAFNGRDIPAALALMTPDVSWPRASEGGRVTGKAAIQDYWTRQWAEFSPSVDPLAFETLADSRVAVKVHQVVTTLDGTPLLDSEVAHTFTFLDGLVQRMDLEESAPWHTGASQPA